MCRINITEIFVTMMRLVMMNEIIYELLIITIIY